MKKQLNGNFLFYFSFKYFLISYDKVLQIDSNYLNPWNRKGIAFNNLGQYKKAIEW